MNFYEHQDRARRRTKIIVFLFIVAVVCIIAIIGVPIGIATEWDPRAMGFAAVFCVLIVGIATLVKLGQLKGGGSVVAEMLGGSLLQRSGSNQAERKVQNIVEEMAIASGMPVPPVYIIDDDSINAFAAGWSSGDAVIGVTRGCIEKLNRDELQGVIAHEFSHISHGDMRINIRLIGVIFGIMALGITGWILVRYIGPVILRTSSRSRSKEGAGGAGVGLAVIVFGLFLALCGAIGTFFGRLIQAAVSRQREFLADASAVQYTRNPSGIGGALKKIGGLVTTNTMPRNSSQCNHMFFSQAMKAMFSSHPPITERISRVEGIDVASLPKITPPTSTKSGAVSHFSAPQVSNSVQQAGAIQENYLQRAKDSIEKIDPILKHALRDSWSARLVMFALVCEPNQEQQRAILEKLLSAPELTEFGSLSMLVANSDRNIWLPMIDIAAPALKQLSNSQRKDFISALLSLIKSDNVVNRFEWVFVSVLRKHLENIPKREQGARLPSLIQNVSIVVGALAYCGASTEEHASVAFNASLSTLGIKSNQIPRVSECAVGVVDKALEKLRTLRFTEKEKLLIACEVCVTHDGQITVAEAETLRAIGDVLDCPIPMFG